MQNLKTKAISLGRTLVPAYLKNAFVYLSFHCIAEIYGYCNYNIYVIEHLTLFNATYVCMYRGRSLWNYPWNWAIQLGLGEGPIGIMGPMSQPRGYHWSRVTHADMYSHTIMWFPYQLYSRQLRVTCILIFRGAVSHRARASMIFCSVLSSSCWNWDEFKFPEKSCYKKDCLSFACVYVWLCQMLDAILMAIGNTSCCILKISWSRQSIRASTPNLHNSQPQAL